MKKARYKHSCDCCHYLGNINKGQDNYDLYFCDSGAVATVIARFGADGKYLSGLSLVKSEATEIKDKYQLKNLAEAIEFLISYDKNPLFNSGKIAIEKGLLDENLNQPIENSKKLRLKK